MKPFKKIIFSILVAVFVFSALGIPSAFAFGTIHYGVEDNTKINTTKSGSGGSPAKSTKKTTTTPGKKTTYTSSTPKRSTLPVRKTPSQTLPPAPTGSYNGRIVEKVEDTSQGNGEVKRVTFFSDGSKSIKWYREPISAPKKPVVIPEFTVKWDVQFSHERSGSYVQFDDLGVNGANASFSFTPQWAGKYKIDAKPISNKGRKWPSWPGKHYVWEIYISSDMVGKPIKFPEYAQDVELGTEHFMSGGGGELNNKKVKDNAPKKKGHNK